METELPCLECSKPFRPGRKTQRFCSRPCKVRWHARDWRRLNPERAKEIDDKSHAPRRAERVARTARWRDEHRDSVRLLDRVRWEGERREDANTCRSANGKKEHIEKPWRRPLMIAKSRTKIKCLPPFELTDSWAEARWTGRCELTDILFVTGKGHGWFFSPSLDRIDPTKGYTPGNARFILWCVNAFKGQGDDEDIRFVARALLENYNKIR